MALTSGLGAALQAILRSGGRAASSAGPMITGSGGRVVRAGAPAAANAATGGGVAGNLLTGLGALELLQLGSGLIRDTGKAAGDVTQAATGGAGVTGTPVPVGTDTRGYTIPQGNPLAYQQYVDAENFRRSALNKLGANLPMLERALTQTEVFNLNQIATARAGERERELARIEGELGALPAAYTAQGRVADAASNVLRDAITTVLQRAPVEKSLALQNIARTNQFSN